MRFNEQIRRTFFVYALVPIFFLCIMSYIFLYVMSYTTHTKRNEKNTIVLASHIEKELNFYEAKAEEMAKALSTHMDKMDQVSMKRWYEEFYIFMSERKLKGNFYVFDVNNQVVMSNTTFVSEYSKQDYSWGIFKKMSLQPEKAWTMPNKTYLGNDKFSILSVGKAIQKSGEVVGFIIFDIKEDSLKAMVGQKSQNNIMITDKHKNIILTTNDSFKNENGKVRADLADDTGYLKLMDNTVYISRSALIQNNLYVYTISFMGFLKDLLKMGFLFLCIMLIVLFWGMSHVAKKIANDKTRVIDEIVRGIEEVQKGNLDTPLHIYSQDEFGIIAEAYNKMVGDIKNLIELSKEKARHSIQSEIKQLESQFNPHFIFNTLEMLKYTMKFDQELAYKMIMNLSSILRYSINGDLSEVTLKEDLGYTKSYLEIQRHRFNERFNYSIDIYDNAEEYRIPKLTIQPLIENAIKYGFYMQKVLTVKISIRAVEDHLVMVVYDDGKGMSEEKVANLNDILKRKIKENQHLGLYNIHRRIQLMYGDSYGLTVISQLEEGTVIKIILPLVGN